MLRNRIKGLKIRLQGQNLQGESFTVEGTVVRLRVNEVTVSVRPTTSFSRSNDERRYSLETGESSVKYSYKIVSEDLVKLNALARASK